MREIKFKALARLSSGECEWFYYTTATGYAIGVGDGVQDWICKDSQFTGLKDKNGKEIYEGDILNVCNGSINFENWMHKPYEVKYKRGAYDICLFCWDENGNSTMDSTHWCEVIGNVFEHPECLTSTIKKESKCPTR